MDLREEYGFFVDVVGSVDIRNQAAQWRLSTIDPETGEKPFDPLVGFLLPNDDTGVGDGFVTYQIKPTRDVVTEEVIDAKATIIFDTEGPIDTPPIFNTVDANIPLSLIQVDATGTDTEYLVDWSGVDVGSGIRTYSVYVLEAGGEFDLWVDNTALTQATYQGEAGKNYEFFVAASDNAGNTEPRPINVPPRFDSEIPDQEATEDQPFEYTFPLDTIRDPDDLPDTLIYTATLVDDRPLPSWLRFNPLTRTFNGTPIQEDVGEYEIKVTVTDSQNQTDEDIFKLTVIAVDDLPVVANPIADFSVDEDAENTTIDLSGVFTDVDNEDELIVKSIFNNNNESLVIATITDNQLIFDYQENQSGFATITIRGTSNDQSIDNTFTVTVNSPVNSVGRQQRFGSIGDDTLNLSSSNNSQIVFSGIGDDVINGVAANFSQSDRLYGGRGDDELLVGTEDILFGGTGNDTLNASQGSNNRLFGEEGNDTLIAGRNDILVGGKDRDTFILANGALPPENSQNLVLDFNSEEDKIVLAGIENLQLNQVQFTANESQSKVDLTVAGQLIAIFWQPKSNSIQELKDSVEIIQETINFGI